MKKLITITSIVLLLLSLTAISHHYVLVPEQFVYQKGDTIKVHLMVGEVFGYEFERDLQDSMTPVFNLITKSGAKNILPMMSDNSKPVAKIPVAFDGLGLIVMQRKPSMIVETPGAF